MWRQLLVVLILIAVSTTTAQVRSVSGDLWVTDVTGKQFARVSAIPFPETAAFFVELGDGRFYRLVATPQTIAPVISRFYESGDCTGAPLLRAEDIALESFAQNASVGPPGLTVYRPDIAGGVTSLETRSNEILGPGFCVAFTQTYDTYATVPVIDLLQQVTPPFSITERVP